LLDASEDPCIHLRNDEEGSWHGRGIKEGEKEKKKLVRPGQKVPLSLWLAWDVLKTIEVDLTKLVAEGNLEPKELSK
jgi:hypothetical protein